MGGTGVLAWCGAVAGLLAPVTFGVFVEWGARRRAGYDPWRDDMTGLGDHTDVVARAFVSANIAVAVLLGVFAAAVAVELPLRWLWIPLVVAAVASAVIGLTACDKRCRWAACPGTAPRVVKWLHKVAAGANGIGIILVPVTASLLLDADRDQYQPLRWYGAPMSIAALAFTLLYLNANRTNRRAVANGEPATAHEGLHERLLWVVGYGWVVLAAASLLSDGLVWPTVLLGVWLAVSLRFVLFPVWRDPAPEFDLDDCQPNTIKAYGGATHGLLLVRRIDDAAGFVSELESALAERSLIRGGQEALASPFAVTIGFSARGLEALGVPHRWNAPFVLDSFGGGMQSRADVLGDTDESAPANWDPEWRTPDDLHVAFWIVARGPEALAATRTGLTKAFPSTTSVVEQPTERLERNGQPIEHFGFVDGLGDPWIDQVPRSTATNGLRTGTGALDRRRRWRPIALGEFVVAHVDETGDVFPVPDPHALFSGGTFMVVRKLEQDVDAYQRFGGDRWGSQLVGREKDGAPLAMPVGSSARVHATDFRFGDDPEGLRCPRGAHIRRANPRDAAGFGTTLTCRRRLIRRGMPYGPPHVDSEAAAPSGGRGLLFVAFNVRIAEQFEFIQSQWLNTGTVLGLGSDPDVIAGQWPASEERQVVLRDESGRPILHRAPRLVRVRGGEYFFVPSLSGLRALVRLSPARSGDG